MARSDCPKCSGTGWKILEGDREHSPAVPLMSETAFRASAAASGSGAVITDTRSGQATHEPRVALVCDCVESEQAARGLGRARIPARYEHCDLASFETDVYENCSAAASFNRDLANAKFIADGFARDYPITSDAGLLFIGPCGTGKTHLAVAVAKQLISRGHEVLFYDYNDLLKEIQGSYNPTNQATEAGVLEPVLNVEVLLLDDLGASKPSTWALETIGHILNTRYNQKRITLLTANYLDDLRSKSANQSFSSQNFPSHFPINSREIDLSSLEAANQPVDPNDTFAAKRAGRTTRSIRDSRADVRLPNGDPIVATNEDTLTERIGTRIRSRLHEMSRTVEIWAPDFRKEIRKASHPR